MEGQPAAAYLQLVEALRRWALRVQEVPSSFSTGGRLLEVRCSGLKERLGESLSGALGRRESPPSAPSVSEGLQLRRLEEEVLRRLLDRIQLLSGGLLADMEEAAEQLATDPRDLQQLSAFAAVVKELRCTRLPNAPGLHDEVSEDPLHMVLMDRARTHTSSTHVLHVSSDQGVRGVVGRHADSPGLRPRPPGRRGHGLQADDWAGSHSGGKGSERTHGSSWFCGSHWFCLQLRAAWVRLVPLVKRAEGVVSGRRPPVADALDSMFSFLARDLRRRVSEATSGPFLDPTQKAQHMAAQLKLVRVHVHDLIAKLQRLGSKSHELHGESWETGGSLDRCEGLGGGLWTGIKDLVVVYGPP